jgi:hypothetical protein
MSLARVRFYQGENRQLAFRVTLNDQNQSMATDTLHLTVRSQPDEDILFVKNDADFDKVYAPSGVIMVTITPADLDFEPGIYLGQLRVVDNLGLIRKGEAFEFEILPALDKPHLLNTQSEAVSETAEVELTII